MWTIARSEAGRWGALLLLPIVGLALAAPWLAPLGPEAQADILGARGRPPLTVLQNVKLDDGSTLLADRATWEGNELVVQRRSRVDRVARETVTNGSAAGVEGRVFFLLGTDRLGRDIWARTAYGARTSLVVGLLSALLSLGLGVTVGALAATGGRVLDGLLMRFVDAMLAIPGLLLVIVLSALLRPGLVILILLIGATGWMGVSRLARAEITSLREREFVLAAQALGQRPREILLRHMLPNAMTPLLVDTSLRVGTAILTESALSFLGLGVAAEIPSWGGMIAHGRPDLVSLWWASTFPGIAIVITVISFNLLADGMRDALDPRMGLAQDGAPVVDEAVAD